MPLLLGTSTDFELAIDRLSSDDDDFDTLLLIFSDELEAGRSASVDGNFDTLLLTFSEEETLTLSSIGDETGETGKARDTGEEGETGEEGVTGDAGHAGEAGEAGEAEDDFLSLCGLVPRALLLSSARAPSPMLVMSFSSVVPLNLLNTFVANDLLTPRFVCSGLPSAVTGPDLLFTISASTTLTSLYTSLNRGRLVATRKHRSMRLANSGLSDRS